MAFTHGTLTIRRRRRSCFLRTYRGTSFMPNTSPVVPILNERNRHKSDTMVAPMRQQRLLEPVPSRVDVSIRFDSEWRASTSRNQIMLRSDQPSFMLCRLIFSPHGFGTSPYSLVGPNVFLRLHGIANLPMPDGGWPTSYVPV